MSKSLRTEKRVLLIWLCAVIVAICHPVKFIKGAWSFVRLGAALRTQEIIDEQREIE